MNLGTLLEHRAAPYTGGVPAWMLGAFRRACISFANGFSDTDTQVWWLQSRTFTIDLRLPKSAELPPAKPWQEYSEEELAVLANCEGWSADSVWEQSMLRWERMTSLQWHNRWQEPAELKRIGNCMVEFAPSGAYVEDWRAQLSEPGPLVGLKLQAERDLLTGAEQFSGGGLIVCGNWAGLVRGRPQPLGTDGINSFRDAVLQAKGNAARLQEYFQFETSLAKGSLERGYKVVLSTNPARIGQALLSLEGFERDGSGVIQRCEEYSRPLERKWQVDTLEPQCDYSFHTPVTTEARTWMTQEAVTLDRYSRIYQ